MLICILIKFSGGSDVARDSFVQVAKHPKAYLFCCLVSAVEIAGSERIWWCQNMAAESAIYVNQSFLWEQTFISWLLL